VDQGPWRLLGVAGQGLGARACPTGRLGTAKGSPGHLAPPRGWGRAKAGPGYLPTGLVRGTKVRPRLRRCGQSFRTRLG